jgi:AdoMet-dependent heme synthase
MEFSIQLHVNTTCNLRCRHCYQNEYVSEADFDKLKYFIISACDDFIVVYKDLEFNITGGEPLLYPYLWDTISIINNNRGKCNLMTNGTLIDDEVINNLLKYQVNNVQISLEGLEKTNDSIRGYGTFNKVCRSIGTLINNKIDVTIAMTINNKNYHELKGFLDFFSQYNINIGFHRYIPLNKTSSHNDEFQIKSSIIWKEIIDFVYNYKLNKNKRIVFNDPLFGLELIKEYELRHRNVPNERYYGCSIGVSAITVMHNGDVYPCRKLPIAIGNVFTSSLMRIWLDSSLLWSFRNREKHNGKCGSCTFTRKCGGCRASSYYFHGQDIQEVMFNEDPYCFNKEIQGLS